MSWSGYYENKLDLKTYIGIINSHAEFFETIINDSPKKVLEVGVGSGATSIFLSHLGLDVTAVDNDQSVIEGAKQNIEKFNSKVSLVYADGFKLPFEDNTFDLVFHQGVFEHFENDDIKKLLKEQLRVAKIVVFSVPNKYYPSKDYGNERLLSKEEWENILSEFKLKKSKDYCHWRLKKRLYSKKPVMYLAEVSKYE